MAEPLPKTLEDAFERARAAINALKQTQPKDRDEARRRSAEIIRMQREVADVSHQIADADAAADAQKRLNADAHADSEGLSDGEVTALAKGLVDWLKPQLDTIKHDITELGKRPVLEDAGVWQERAVYRPGQVVTYKGSAWVCREANSNARPGKSDVWRLMVKSDQQR